MSLISSVWVCLWSCIVPIILFLPLIYFSSLYSYLFFHSVVEIFCVVIAAGVFMFAWNGRRFNQNDYFFFIGVTFLSVGVFDFLHTLAYKGMQIFPGFDANLPTQLWIGSRYLLAVSLMVAPVFITRKLNHTITLILYCGATALLLLSIFVWRNFPVSYIEGVGLTLFKKTSEYIISVLFVVVAGLWFRYRNQFNRNVFVYLMLSLGLNIISELLFTWYVGVYDFFNKIGHIAKLFAYYMVYKAIIEVGLTQPHNLLFLELKRLGQQKEELMHVVSHELKNPLTSIKVYTSLLSQQLRGGNKKIDQHYVSVITAQTDRITRLVNELTDLSKIEAHIAQLNLTTFDFDTFLKQAVAELTQVIQDHPLIVKGKAGVTIRGDKDQLNRVLTNLVTNAAKYSGKLRSITLTVSVSEKHLTVAVKDRGIGVPQNKRTKIFDKYYRTSGAEQQSQGLGLGLYICKHIIEQHRGKIWVSSSKGKGSIFYFSLPIKR